MAPQHRAAIAARGGVALAGGESHGVDGNGDAFGGDGDGAGDGRPGDGQQTVFKADAAQRVAAVGEGHADALRQGVVAVGAQRGGIILSLRGRSGAVGGETGESVGYGKGPRPNGGVAAVSGDAAGKRGVPADKVVVASAGDVRRGRSAGHHPVHMGGLVGIRAVIVCHGEAAAEAVVLAAFRGGVEGVLADGGAAHKGPVAVRSQIVQRGGAASVPVPDQSAVEGGVLERDAGIAVMQDHGLGRGDASIHMDIDGIAAGAREGDHGDLVAVDVLAGLQGQCGPGAQRDQIGFMAAVGNAHFPLQSQRSVPRISRQEKGVGSGLLLRAAGQGGCLYSAGARHGQMAAGLDVEHGQSAERIAGLIAGGDGLAVQLDGQRPVDGQRRIQSDGLAAGGQNDLAPAAVGHSLCQSFLGGFDGIIRPLRQRGGGQQAQHQQRREKQSKAFFPHRYLPPCDRGANTAKGYFCSIDARDPQKVSSRRRNRGKRSIHFFPEPETAAGRGAKRLSRLTGEA